MKHLERLSSIAFVTVLISLVFHLLAMSFNRWKENNCTTCEATNPLRLWYTSLHQRCYQSSITSLISSNDNLTLNKLSKSFVTEICIPNQYLMAKIKANASDCIDLSFNNPATVCSLETYDKTICKCDYTSGTKALLAFTILASLSLGIMLFCSHIISFIKTDYILRWLIPLSFSLLIFSIVCLLIALIIAGSRKYEDVNQIRYRTSLIEAITNNKTELEQFQQELQNSTNQNYSVKIGWCFGMEILALQFSIISLVIYALMFLAKQRPETKT